MRRLGLPAVGARHASPQGIGGEQEEQYSAHGERTLGESVAPASSAVKTVMYAQGNITRIGSSTTEQRAEVKQPVKTPRQPDELAKEVAGGKAIDARGDRGRE